MSKHIGILVAYGPEVRLFLHSGLLRKLAEKYKVSIITPYPLSKAFTVLQERDDIQIIRMPLQQESALLRRLRRQVAKLHNGWLESLGRKKWQHALPSSPSISSKDVRRFLPESTVMKILVKYASATERLVARGIGTDQNWHLLLKKLQISGLIAASHTGSKVIPALQTAYNIKVKTVIIHNSWKDTFVNAHLPISPSAVLVWDQNSASLLQQMNPWCKETLIKPVGSLLLEFFHDPSTVLSKGDFYAKTGLDKNRPYICYTAASPLATQHEERIIQFLAKAIAENKITGSPQLLLRLNPMEDGNRFRQFLNSSDVIIQKPLWEWIPDKDWCCPLLDDQKMWISTIFHSSLNISLPSTVTLEFASLERQVINVCFDPEAQERSEISNKRFWNAEHYTLVRVNEMAQPAYSWSQLLDLTNKALAEPDNKQQSIFVRNRNLLMESHTLEEVMKYINMAMKTDH